jgi:DNA-binding transcriptional LysR family regulator
MIADRLSGFVLFTTVVEAGSLTAAARELGLTKSAVSKALSRLEARLGARLVNRTTRRLGLTEAGEAFYGHCRRILAEAEAAEEEVGRLQAAPRGRLRVNGPMSFGTAHLAPLLAAFMTRYPDLALDVVFNDRRVDLVEEGFDVAVRIGRLADSSLVARRLCDERHTLCAAPAYWDRRGRPSHPSELAQHDCLSYAYLSTGEQWRFDGPDGPVSVRIRGRMRSNNGEALAAAAISGEGVALLPSFVTWRHIAEGRLEIGLAGYEPPPMGVYAVWPPASQPPAKVRALVDFLAEHLGPNPYWNRLPANQAAE